MPHCEGFKLLSKFSLTVLIPSFVIVGYSHNYEILSYIFNYVIVEILKRLLVICKELKNKNIFL